MVKSPFPDCKSEAAAIDRKVAYWQRHASRLKHPNWRLAKLIVTGRAYAAHLRVRHILEVNKLWQYP